jgi:hypothetical protein
VDTNAELKRRDGDRSLGFTQWPESVRGATGQLLYTEGFLEDITERKRMQDALRKSEENIRHGVQI